MKIGVAASLRSLMAPAVVAWSAHFGWLNLTGSRLAFMRSKAGVIILSILAIGELIGNKLPKVPKWTALAPLLARVVTGGLCGGCICVATDQSLGIGIFLGGIGAVIGAFTGYEIRRRLVANLHSKDFVIAIWEDLIAIALAFFLVSR